MVKWQASIVDRPALNKHPVIRRYYNDIKTILIRYYYEFFAFFLSMLLLSSTNSTSSSIDNKKRNDFFSDVRTATAAENVFDVFGRADGGGRTDVYYQLCTTQKVVQGVLVNKGDLDSIRGLGFEKGSWIRNLY